ncbi:MAG: endonuclease domain-containing protein [Actinobacteria bacterium]|nr:endonuclease domain-containing protein [Actinomycetota bacterium]
MPPPPVPSPPPEGLPRGPWRAAVAHHFAVRHCGLARRADLLGAGFTKAELEADLDAGRLITVGPNTIAVPTAAVPHWLGYGKKYDGHHLPLGVTGMAKDGRRARQLKATALMAPPRKAGPATVDTAFAPFWWAVWESGTRAALDGASALIAEGMSGFVLDHIEISVPLGARIHPHPGVRITQRRVLGPLRPGLPRVEPATATVRAAQLAVSDRQAALLICLPVQQRIVRAEELLARWTTVRRSPRRSLLDAVIKDVCDGAHSLGELDFARFCRERGLPEPVRQQLRRGPKGRIYLDVAFECGLVVEIDGVQHSLGLAPVDDALRANAVTLQNRRVLRIPVLGLRLDPGAFLDQVAHGIRLMTRG